MRIADEYDAIVLGAGAAGMTAAAVAATGGLRVLLIEKSAQVGGTTAISGGMVWIPANAKMAEAGITDTVEQARLYLCHCVPGGFNEHLRSAFLASADAAIAYLERNTSVRLKPVVNYPDYYPDLPGATGGGRVLEPVAFDGRMLGKHFRLLRPPLPEFMLFGGMMVDRADIPHFRKAGRSSLSAARVARLVARYGWQRLFANRGTSLYLGNTLAARLLHSQGFATVSELSLASGRRADLVALGAAGEIWIVEIKSTVADFRADRKWMDYRLHCDRLFFATTLDLPREIFPIDAGLIVADAFGAAIMREAPKHALQPMRIDASIADGGR